jgi:hypothetical protein
MVPIKDNETNKYYMEISKRGYIELAIRETDDLDMILDWWWDDFEYRNNTWETKEQFIKRRDLVIPLIINEKLKRNVETEIF